LYLLNLLFKDKPMMTGPYTPTISITNGGSPNTITAAVNMPSQTTPFYVREYLMQMGFSPTSGGGSTIWARGGSYYTWEQAVAYCLIKPFLNP
jgi:hypothetical protein